MNKKPKTPRPLTRAKIRANRKKWIAALRSGEYKQTTGTLCRKAPKGPRYCCLGVAHNVCGAEPSDSGKSLSGVGMQVLGLSTAQHLDLMCHNDGCSPYPVPKKFRAIASIIEAMPIVYPEGTK